MPTYRDPESNLNFHYYGDVDAPCGKGKEKQEFPVLYNAAVAARKPWEDPYFPADGRSLKGLTLTYSDGTPFIIEWKRAAEVSAELFEGDPPLFHGDFTQFNIKQGSVGDCWFLAVLAHAATKPELINTLVPKDNNDAGFSTGIFHFRFWCRGYWVDVPVDDRIPCIMTRSGKIHDTVMSKPTREGGFWGPLLEKAYAKVFGTYGDIEGGASSEAMVDFTGGVNSIYRIEEVMGGDKLKNILIKAVRDKCVITFGTNGIPVHMRRQRTDVDPAGGNEHISYEGITGHHAYTVLDIQDVTSVYDPNSKRTLVSCRNPWGTETEWNGEFNDQDPIWEDWKPNLVSGTPDDGQFWMPLEVIPRYAHTVYTCIWNAGYRGDETVELAPGAMFYQDHSNFTQKNSGVLRDSRGLEGLGGYLVHLKPMPASEGLGEMKNGLRMNCGVGIDMIYKDYTKSGKNPQIPSFGFKIVWSANSDPKDFMFTQQMNGILFYGQTAAEQREITYGTDLPEGTVWILPWLTQWDGKGSEFFIRIIAEGKVEKLEPGWTMKPRPQRQFQFQLR